MTNREFALSLPAYLPGIAALFRSRPVTHLARIPAIGPLEACCGSVSEDDDLSTNMAIVTCPQCLRRGA